MSNSIKIVLGLALVMVATACAQPEPEPVFVEPAPIVDEPTFNKL